MTWDEIQRKLIEMGIEYGPVVLGAVLTLVLGWIAAKIVRGIVRRVLRKSKVDETLVGFVCNVTYMMLMTFVVISTLGGLGVKTGSFVAIVGAAGLAIGFALQGSLQSFAAGVLMIIFRPMRVGDFVEAAGVAGTVQEIQVFTTILNTKDNKRVIVPNSAVMSGSITNYSANANRRVDLVIGIGYGDDIPKAKRILNEICAAEPLVLETPAPQIAVVALADSSVNFNVRPWCKQEDYWKVHNSITETVKMRFDAEGVSIPFPQRDVHLHQVPA